ncbi:hypothetical protein E2C01_013153 [Portunus trituberculatus]|uniref:Uncharacterized protein n=1 Tax=Portunus trituberculatus TaxID=210409 RepID=A0A5B7DFV7_PORTR|nr:hypothetical protein [Portunus trituberculatus]
MSGFFRDIEDTMLVILLLQELKEDLHIIKNRMDMLNPECDVNKIVQNPLQTTPLKCFIHLALKPVHWKKVALV